MGSTTSSTSAAITAPPASIEPPEPKPSRPGPPSPAWPLGHKPSCDRPSCAFTIRANQVDGAQQSPHQRLAVNLVGLGASPPARGRERRRVDDMALNVPALQHTVEPKTVEPCLLNDDQWKQLTCPSARFRLQRGKARQERQEP